MQIDHNASVFASKHAGLWDVCCGKTNTGCWRKNGKQ